MTQLGDTLLQLAAQAGLRMNSDGAVWGHARALEVFANRLLAAERENCARLCESLDAGDPAHMAAAIRRTTVQ